MKYIVDIDALIDCLDLLPNPDSVDISGIHVYLNDVRKLIQKFPKDEYETNEVKYRNATK